MPESLCNSLDLAGHRVSLNELPSVAVSDMTPGTKDTPMLGKLRSEETCIFMSGRYWVWESLCVFEVVFDKI